MATIAAAMAAAVPGERLWYWLAESDPEADAAEGVVPLIVQPVAWDPNHDRTNWLVERNTDRGAAGGQTGTATICDDGTIQFIGIGLNREMLERLARWVAANHAKHRALGRLVDCQFLVASGGLVDAVIAEPSLWKGVSRDPVPGTLLATAAILEALPVGGDCWFWITGGPSPSSTPFLHLLPTGDDPEGLAFQSALPRLYKRFPQSFSDAVSGLMSRPTVDRWLFSSQDERAPQFAAQLKALLDRYGAEFPALRALEGAVLVQAGADGQPKRVA